MNKRYEMKNAHRKYPVEILNEYQEAIRCLNSRKAASKTTLKERRGSDDMENF